MDIVKVNVAGQCSRFYTTAAMVGGYNVKYKSVRVPQLPQRWWRINIGGNGNILSHCSPELARNLREV